MSEASSIMNFRIADYVNKVVGTRKIPNGKKGAVVIKLDVEVKLNSNLLKNNFMTSDTRDQRVTSSWI